MEGLKVLAVELDVPMGWQEGWRAREAELLRAGVEEMGMGRGGKWEGLEEFEVVVNWPAGEGGSQLNGLPCRVVRRGRGR